MIVKVEIGMASLADIAEKACKIYRRELAEVEFLNDIQCIGGSLADVVRLWAHTIKASNIAPRYSRLFLLTREMT